ncbi:hypothetical protein [Chromobacterium violaceum]|uniref:hypothetical protein n=1 Tax=Chromobacterium violaceum TaxID=536 RepID=UPI0012D30477|nr:hypothetical protein [Chromobacterium violaceum]
MKQIPFFLASILLAFVLTSCATTNAAESNDPYLKKGINLDNAALNYVNRSVFFRIDGGHNGGGLARAARDENPGTAGSSCCFNITDLKKPVQIELRWSPITEPAVLGPNGRLILGKELSPAITKTITVNLPQRLPHIVQNDYKNSEDVMCLVIKDLDKAELKYSKSYDCKDE